MTETTISTDDDVEMGLEALVALDPRLRLVAERAGPLPLRRLTGGLAGLVGIVIGQQVSRASADAIRDRLRREIDPGDARALAAADDEALRRAGLSRPKQRTMRALAAATLDGRLDFARLERLCAEDAIAELVAVPGIGPWTAECYLLFCAGHPDVFPAGDLALQVAVGHAFADLDTPAGGQHRVGSGTRSMSVPTRSGAKAVAVLARSWSPHRAVAARLFWAYYAAIKRREAVPVG